MVGFWYGAIRAKNVGTLLHQKKLGQVSFE